MYKRGPSLLASAIAMALVIAYWAPQLTAGLPQTRTISLYNIHTKETVTVEYKRDGKYVPAAMEKVDWILRDWRRNEKTRMDPKLIDLLWEIHAELGSEKPIHIISGYRSQATNSMLRKTRGGQATKSRHILGMAADVHFPDVPIRRLRYSALVRERGGVGYYPTSAIPFVHVDTGRVRAWPRLPRHELALLFPDGRTRHVPTDGKPLSPSDARIARAKHADLATQVAAYQNLREAAQGRTQIASAETRPPRATPAPAPQQQRIALASPPTRSPANDANERPPVPRLVAEPQLVRRLALASRTSDEDRMKLAQLATAASFGSGPPQLLPASFGPDAQATPRPDTAVSVNSGAKAGARLAALDIEAEVEPAERRTGRFGWGAGWRRDASQEPAVSPTVWAIAPAYDDEHPEELSYRPFPIVPYLTETPSPDDPALARMEYPDVARTLELLDQAGELPPMRLRPEPQNAQLLWAQQFQGEAVSLSSVFDGKRPSAPGGITERSIRLSSR